MQFATTSADTIISLGLPGVEDISEQASEIICSFEGFIVRISVTREIIVAWSVDP